MRRIVPQWRDRRLRQEEIRLPVGKHFSSSEEKKKEVEAPCLGRFRTYLMWLPHRIRKEFTTRGGDARFLVWVSFLIAFVWARTWVTLIGKNMPNFTFHDEIEFGQRIVIAGYHPHHIALGVLLLAVAGWIGIFFGGKQLHRVAGVMYGVGLGLIVDEMGYIVEGMTPYRDDWVEVFLVVTVLGALFMSAVYFPSFWSALETRVRLAFRRHGRSRPEPPPAAAPGAEAQPAPATSETEPPAT